jgi:hypothetical protein
MSASQQTNALIEFTLQPRSSDVGRSHSTVAAEEPSAWRRIPRITKLLALAIRLDGLLREGEVTNCAAIARAGGVSRARVAQILSLLDLAPAIQEHILYMTCSAEAPDPIRERKLRKVTKLVRWDQQQRRYEELLIAAGAEAAGWEGGLGDKERSRDVGLGSERVVR